MANDRYVYPFTAKITPEVLEAVCRLLDPNPGQYPGLKLGGDVEVAKRFTRDVLLVAETLGQIIHDPLQKFLKDKPPVTPVTDVTS